MGSFYFCHSTLNKYGSPWKHQWKSVYVQPLTREHGSDCADKQSLLVSVQVTATNTTSSYLKTDII